MAAWWRPVTPCVILLHRSGVPMVPILGIQGVIKMTKKEFSRMEENILQFFGWKIHVQANMASCVLGHPKLFPAPQNNLPLAWRLGKGSTPKSLRLKAEKQEQKTKISRFYIQTDSQEMAIAGKGNELYSCFQSIANRIFSSFGIVLQDLFSVAVPPFTMSKYPVWRNASLSLTPRAVMTITGMVREFPIFEFRNKVSKSKPLVPGIWMSDSSKS